MKEAEVAILLGASSELKLSSLRKPPKNVLLSAIVAYVVAALGWTFICLKYLDPIIHRMIVDHVLTLWNTQFATLVGTWVGEAFFPLILYLLIVRPLKLKPILYITRQGNSLRTLLVVVFAVVLFLVFTPWHHGVSMKMLLIFITFIGVGFAEEFCFRGILTRVFRDRLGIVWATLIVSLLFSASHWAEWLYREHVPLNLIWQDFTTIFVMGVLFTVMAWRSGTLWWAIMIHTLNDFESLLDPSFGGTWEFSIIFMLSGIIGAEILRLVSTAKEKSAKVGA